MPALNFQKQFAEDVRTGKKTRTIRARRIDGRWPAKAGDKLTLYTGMRTKQCRLLARAECFQTTDVTIHERGVTFLLWEFKPEGLDAFAQADGFRDWPAMWEWFRATHGLPFDGRLIEWRLVP